MTDILGSHPLSIRLVAWVAGMLILPSVYWAGRVLYSPNVGLLAMAVCAGLPALVMYSVNARGYSMVVLCFILMVAIGASQLQQVRRGGWWLYGGIASIGFYTIPVMLYPVTWVSFWLLLEGIRTRQWRTIWGMLLGLTIGGLVTVALYVPIIQHDGGMDALINNGWIVRLPLQEAIQHTPNLWEAFQTLLFWQSWVTWAIVALAMMSIIRHNHIGRTRFSLAVGIITLPLVVWFTRTYPYPRTWLFILPIIAWLASAGAVGLFTRRGHTRWLDGVSVAIAISLCAWVVGSGVLYQDRETGDAYGARDGLEAIQQLTAPTVTKIGIVANPHLEYALRYYITQMNWEAPPDLLFVEWEAYLELVMNLDAHHHLFILTHGHEVPTLAHYLAFLDPTVDRTRYTLVQHETYFDGRASSIRQTCSFIEA